MRRQPFCSGGGSGIAQQPRFRVFDLGPLGFTPAFDDIREQHGTVAINNWGQVTYARMVEIQPGVFEMHGWAYLPQDGFGQTAGFLDLNDASGLSTDAAAWDINMSGQIAGQIDGTTGGEGQALVWQLGATVTACPLGFLDVPGLPPEPWSAAYAINDASPPVVVGAGLASLGPPCSDYNEWGFRAEFSFGAQCPTPNDVFMQALLPADGSLDDGTFARAVNTPAGTETVVGYSVPSVFLPCQGPGPCGSGHDALTWPPVQPVDPLATLPAPAGGHQARGVNEAGQIVGLGFDENDPIDCRSRALFWADADPMTAPFNLGSTALGIPAEEQTRAEAINNRSPVQVVGWNLETGRPLLWEQDGAGGWNQAVDLQDESDAGSEWDLVQTHDINDVGCIAGWGQYQPEGQPATVHAFFLYECPYDCGGDNDANVGIVDFLELLATWQQVGVPCDVDPDDQGAGINDFLALLAAWGPCCSTTFGSPPQSVQDCIDRFGTEDPLVLEHCICAVEPEECPE